MVKLRLKRMGRKRRPFYRIVAMTDNQSRSGQALEELGTYDPVHSRFDVNEDAAITWLNNGAQMTPTVHDLFNNKGLLARWRGFEGVENENALKADKPKRRKKLAGAATAATADDAPADAAEAPEAVAEAPEAEVAEQAAEPAPEEATPAEDAAEQAPSGTEES
ncbi:MAG TPA: 30S ribosomal protein S16 [Candidatus Latescibacteria bacterium]|nr:30S ribosomal protein S16 [Candidatus Latescibacterota bacterium]HJP29422.1 30S ribosomal protein S16 [Candidatus Latescibacterota bacterium]